MENSKINESLIKIKTPAVTIVAACINAETGVGPSIASNNQTCKPIWADLPITPKHKKKKTKSIKVIETFKNGIKTIEYLK